MSELDNIVVKLENATITHTTGIDSDSTVHDCDRKGITTSKCDSKKEEHHIELKDRNIFSIQQNIKKSVAFDPNNENVLKKFIEGEVIIDKQNPFKDNLTSDENGGRPLITKNRNEKKTKSFADNEFVTTDEVLRESKYVKTYVKNPDKVFKYDPNLLARVKLTELNEKPIAKPRRSLLTKRTQNQLKDSNKSCSLAPLQQNKSNVRNNRHIRACDTKIPKFKKVSKSNYPDLSDIKVKTGTDLDESFYVNPAEVVINAKRFDKRVKTLKISPEDELDEIDEPLTSMEETYDEVEYMIKHEEKKGSFTNTVNSKEFKEFLNKKGLELTPKKQNKAIMHIEKEATKNPNENIRPTEISTGLKKEKKPSVLQRLFNPSIFSSRRRTSPKNSTPIPQNIYENTKVATKSKINIRRIILEGPRCSVLQNTEAINDNYDSRSTSISSVLSNADDKTRQEDIASQKPKPAIRNSLVRQSFIDKQPLFSGLEDSHNFRRTVSMDRPEIVRRTLLKSVPISTGKTSIESKSNTILPRNSKDGKEPGIFSDCNSTINNKLASVSSKTYLQSADLPTIEWNELRQMQENNDKKMFLISNKKTPNIPMQAVKTQDSVYETVPNIRPEGKMFPKGALSQKAAGSLQNNSNFVRGSFLRNSYCGGYSSKDSKLYMDSRHQFQPLQGLRTTNSTLILPARSQSVLDNVTSSQNDTYGYIGSPRVTMRKKCNPEILTKEEIMSRVREFCRKSMNHAHTNTEQMEIKNLKSVSPVSYVSFKYKHENSLQLIAPQVPQRVQSLVGRNTVGATSPIYSHVSKQGSLQCKSPEAYYSSVRKMNSFGNRAQGRNTSPIQPATTCDDECYASLRHQPPYKVGKADVGTTPLILSPNYLNDNFGYMNAMEKRRHMSSLRANPVPRKIVGGAFEKYNDQLSRPASALGLMEVQRERSQYISPAGRMIYESESGSEAGEIQRIMQRREYEEDWQNEKTGRNHSNEQVSDERRRSNRREDPRRHTLGNDMLYCAQGQPQQRAVDLEAPPIRGYAPINQGPLFDDDPGIMSEVETASTGFRRGGKQRSSLPVVRTPSKTLERPLGLVFLQYRSETKRALLPNEITSIDTVRALFVRSFPRQLTMAYLEGPNVKIYIHDASKDMFYELEDVRLHLREIRDRSVLRLFESNEVVAPQVLPGGPGVPQPLPQSGGGPWDQDQSYFSEPEFDSEYHHQHIHKSKGTKPTPYYITTTQTLPRMYTDRNKNTVDGYTSSPERGTRGGYEEPYYSQYGTHGGAVTPIIDEEQRCDGSLADDQYSLYGLKVPARLPRTPNQIYDPSRPEDLHRIRVEHMERQLANLTGLVQKALNQNPQLIGPAGVVNSNYLGVPPQCRGGLDDMDGHSSGSSTSIQDKSVSFEKSVSFSDDIQGVPKSYSPQHTADTKPPKPAIKSSTLPRTSSQERDRLKPPPPPKPIALASPHPNFRPDIALAPEVYNHLRGLQKKAKDLRMEVRTLRRLSQAQAIAVREDIKDTFIRIRATILASTGSYWGQGDQERTRLSREEELYKQEVIRLEKDLGDLETSVEELRGEVINRRTRVNMAAVEDMALVLSRASKTVAELKLKFPSIQQGLHSILTKEMEKVVREEKFLKDEPDRLESALRRCKKLTGTLVTLKRLASVQEQRLPPAESTNDDVPRSADISSTNKPVPNPRLGSVIIGGGVAPENALDALLDELQTFAKPQQQQDIRVDDSTSDDSSQTLHNTITTQLSQSNIFQEGNFTELNTICAPASGNKTFPGQIGSLRRLHSYPSGSDTDTSPPQPLRPIGKPPVPERNADLLSKVGNKRIPPPPPPRTSSRSPLASPTSPNIPQRLPSVCESEQIGNGISSGQDGSGNSSGNESNNDHAQRQFALEMRHQELLKKQKMLQEQYARLQQMSKNSIALPPVDVLQLKKTGSESNLTQKMGLHMTATGSMKNLNADINLFDKNEKTICVSSSSTGDINSSNNHGAGASTTNKVYETDIL